jgi:hypothetical protein
MTDQGPDQHNNEQTLTTALLERLLVVQANRKSVLSEKEEMAGASKGLEHAGFTASSQSRNQKRPVSNRCKRNL